MGLTPWTFAPCGRVFGREGVKPKPHQIRKPLYCVADVLCPHCERIAELELQKDSAYSERDRLVAALSHHFPSWLERHPKEEEWEDDWRWTVFIHTPAGQCSWHIHDSELKWFDHLPRSGAHRWDGHGTEEKYDRLARAMEE